MAASPQSAPRTWIVDQAHSTAADGNPGTATAPLRTINAALAQAGHAERHDSTSWPETFALPLDLWQAVSGNDRHSAIMRCARDALQSRVVSWQCTFDDPIRSVICQPVTGVSHDWFGLALPDQPLPGPFQQLDAGENRDWLWPLPVVTS